MEQSEVDIFIARVGERVQTLRIQLGISQRELSLRADLDIHQVQRIEKGEHSPTLTTLLKVAQGLGVDVLSLLRFDEDAEAVT